MTSNTPLVHAYSRLVNKAAAEYYAAALSNQPIAHEREKQAKIWFAASEEVWNAAGEYGADYEENAAMKTAFDQSGVLDAMQKLNHMRLYGEQGDEHE